MANTTCIIISPVITRVSLKKDQRMCQSEQVHACHHVCITSLNFLVPTAKANDAAGAGEIKISIGIA